MRIGQGYDVHRLVAGRRLVLGGIEIPCERGLEGHSDGDALLHAVADAILGAIGEGDLGRHFPSSDERWRGADSGRILREVVGKMERAGWQIANVDATIVAQVPRLAPHQPAMRARLAELLGTPLDRVNLKVTSTDHLGAVGREEGIAALAVVLLEPVRKPGERSHPSPDDDTRADARDTARLTARDDAQVDSRDDTRRTSDG